MSTPGSWERAAGLTVIIIFFSAGAHSGACGVGLILCFAGVLAGVGLVGVGVRMGDDPEAPVVPEVFDGARALAAFRRRHLTILGILIASSAVTAVSGQAGPLICFALFALFLLGLSLINIGVTGE